MFNLFSKTKTYTFAEIVKIAKKNNFTTIDCLKEENVISLECFDGENLSGENVFEFEQVKDKKFKLKWFDEKLEKSQCRERAETPDGIRQKCCNSK